MSNKLIHKNVRLSTVHALLILLFSFDTPVSLNNNAEAIVILPHLSLPNTPYPFCIFVTVNFVMCFEDKARE